MTSEQNEEAAGKMLGGMVRDTDEYYAMFKGQHINQRRVDVAVVRSVAWFAVFAALGIGAYVTLVTQLSKPQDSRVSKLH